LERADRSPRLFYCLLWHEAIRVCGFRAACEARLGPFEASIAFTDGTQEGGAVPDFAA
jgi:hypothetical protein